MYYYEQTMSIGGRKVGDVRVTSRPMAQVRGGVMQDCQRITKAEALRLLAAKGYRGRGGRDYLARMEREATNE